MHETEIQFGFGLQAKLAERPVIGWIRAFLGYRQVQPVEAAGQPAGNPICDRHQFGGVARFFEVTPAAVAVAKMEAEFDRLGPITVRVGE